jgi:hypothetical protein
MKPTLKEELVKLMKDLDIIRLGLAKIAADLDVPPPIIIEQKAPEPLKTVKEPIQPKKREDPTPFECKQVMK